jgi:hypothetical protein
MISQQILKQRSQDKAWLHYADKARLAGYKLGSAERPGGLRSAG